MSDQTNQPQEPAELRRTDAEEHILRGPNERAETEGHILRKPEEAETEAHMLRDPAQPE